MESNDYIKYPRGRESEDVTSNVLSEPLVAYLPRVHVGFMAGLSFPKVASTHVSGQDLVRLQEQMCLTPQAFADMMGISKSKYYDLMKQEKLDATVVDALADFAQLWQLGLQAFDEDRDLMLQWLSTRNENLGGIQPISLIASRVGRRALEKAFLRIEYSTYG